MHTLTSSGHLVVSSHSITFSLYKEHNFFLMYHLYWETDINMYRYLSFSRLIVAVDHSFRTTYETYGTRKQRFTRLYCTGYFLEFRLILLYIHRHSYFEHFMHKGGSLVTCIITPCGVWSSTFFTDKIGSLCILKIKALRDITNVKNWIV